MLLYFQIYDFHISQVSDQCKNLFILDDMYANAEIWRNLHANIILHILNVGFADVDGETEPENIHNIMENEEDNLDTSLQAVQDDSFFELGIEDSILAEMGNDFDKTGETNPSTLHCCDSADISREGDSD